MWIDVVLIFITLIFISVRISRKHKFLNFLEFSRGASPELFQNNIVEHDCSADNLPENEMVLQDTKESVSVAIANFTNFLSDPVKNIVVFYGSQTGTAESLANRLVQEGNSMGLSCILADLEVYDMSCLRDMRPPKIAIFVLATYGDGEPTDNARPFFNWLQNGSHLSNSLRTVQFTIFGLGNKSYEHYNAAARYLNKRMVFLGAEKVFRMGEGDDDHNLEEDFILWKAEMWHAIYSKFEMKSSINVLESVSAFVPKILQLDEVSHLYQGELVTPWKITKQGVFDSNNPFYAKITSLKILTHQSKRVCLHMEVNLTGSGLNYEPGDHVGVFPQNDPLEVEKLGGLLNISSLDAVFSMTATDSSASKRHPFPCPCSFRVALTHYIDFLSPLRANVLKFLAQHTSDFLEKSAILQFDKSIHHRNSVRRVFYERRSIIDILEEFPSCHPPLFELLELLPRIQCRYYSISSSPKIYPDSIHITAIVVKYKTKLGERKGGLCTTWLHRQYQDSKYVSVPIYVRRSPFKLPSHMNRPIILIGSGTGLAPFRGFLQDREHSYSIKEKFGEVILFFGCRHRRSDFIYEEEILDYHSRGVISHLYLAFSRDQDHKIYVQHRMLEVAELLWELIDTKDAHLYVCGDGKHMVKDVHRTLVNIIKFCSKKFTEPEAEEYLENLHSVDRYSRDSWS